MLFVSFIKGPGGFPYVLIITAQAPTLIPIDGITLGDHRVFVLVGDQEVFDGHATFEVSLKEVLFIEFLVDDKGVIYKPAPEPGMRMGGRTKSFLLKVLHIEVSYYGAYWGTHGCTLNLFKEVALEGEIGVFRQNSNKRIMSSTPITVLSLRVGSFSN